MSNVIGKVYSNRSNALRAVKKAFGAGWANTVELTSRGKGFAVTAVETKTVRKLAFNKKLGIPKAQPTVSAEPRATGSVGEVWEEFPKLLAKGYRRVDIIDELVHRGYKYWMVRSQLGTYLRAANQNGVTKQNGK